MLIFQCILLYILLLDVYIESETISDVEPLNIAYCLTGQLARLELISKIRNIWIPNAIIGHNVDVFIYLDGNVSDVKQTYWRFDYSENVYGHLSARQIKRFIEFQLIDSLESSYNESRRRIVIHDVRVESPPQKQFALRGHKVPVSDKTGPIDPFATPTSKEPAYERWQNNMRWMNGLRECIRWIQRIEVRDNKFYQIVVRMRDDSYALKPWLIDPVIYRKHFVSTSTGASFGFNDHDFTTDRQWADVLMRGAIEDYYFNQTLDKEYWLNPEHRFFTLAQANSIPQLSSRFCAHPMLPLRGPYNHTHWRLHVAFAEHVLDVCLGDKYVQDKLKRNKGIPQSRVSANEQRRLTDETISWIDWIVRIRWNVWYFYDQNLSPYGPSIDLLTDKSNGIKMLDKSTKSNTKTSAKSNATKRSNKGKKKDKLVHIGLRRLDITNPYTKAYLLHLIARNRALVTKYQETPQQVNGEDHCCSKNMISVMKEQIVNIERVYDY